MKSSPILSVRRKKAKINLSSILKENSSQMITKTWSNLKNGITSKFSNNKKIIVWNKFSFVTKNNKGKKRHCWTVNVSRYGNGFKKSKSIPTYHLAYLSNLHKRAFKKKVKTLSNGEMQITHTCGNGRSNNKHDTLVCCNPSHLKVRSKSYNNSQTHCHYFLKLNKQARKKFFAANICPHVPTCF